jgi:hypothetical protein
MDNDSDGSIQEDIKKLTNDAQLDYDDDFEDAESAKSDGTETMDKELRSLESHIASLKQRLLLKKEQEKKEKEQVQKMKLKLAEMELLKQLEVNLITRPLTPRYQCSKRKHLLSTRKLPSWLIMLNLWWIFQRFLKFLSSRKS